MARRVAIVALIVTFWTGPAAAVAQAPCELHAHASVVGTELSIDNDDSTPWTDIHIAIFGDEYLPDSRSAPPIPYVAPTNALRFGVMIKVLRTSGPDGPQEDRHQSIWIDNFSDLRDSAGNSWMRSPREATVLEMDVRMGAAVCRYAGSIEHPRVDYLLPPSDLDKILLGK